MLNCALIGYGYWGPNIAKSIARLSNVNLSAICDLDKNRLNSAKVMYPQVYITDRIDQIIKDPNIDAVIIATPASTHYKLSAKALKFNKHVLIEKPIATSSQQVEDLRKINKQSKKVIMVGHTFEYNPAIIKIKKIIKEESFGNVYYIYSSRVNLGQVRGDVNALWNLAPHDISILNFLLNGSPIKVKAIGACYLRKGIEDVVFVVAEYPKGVLVKIHVSWLDPAKERKLTIVGSRKMLVFDDLDNEMPLKIYDKRVDTGEVAKGINSEYKIKLHSGDIYAPQIENQEPLMEELKHFFQCIEKNKQPLTDLDNGYKVVKILEACQKSLKGNNRWIKI